MKRILITGTQGYIGSALAQYLRRRPEEYQVDFLSLRGEAWRQADFGGYDAIVHAAAIVHQPKSKDDPSQAELYDRVNHQLTRELAQKAKNEGVSQFLFLSSESVYGLHAPVGKTLQEEIGGPQVLIGAGVNARVIETFREAFPQAEAFHMSGNKEVESGMIFRREGVPMGAPGLDEWHIPVTSREAVEQAKAVLNR